jgi:hypothetical protein
MNANFGQVNERALEALVGIAGDGQPLGNLLENDYGLAAEAITQSLLNGIGQGFGADAVARAMNEQMGIGMDKALLISRTELNRAYRTSSTETYKASGIVDGWMRLVARDEACLACIVLDGEKFDTADEMDDHPNGRCTCVPILTGMAAPEWEKAQDWFANQPESRQREIMGNTRFDLYKSGTPLSDFAGKAHSDIWGDSPALTNIGDLPNTSKVATGESIDNTGETMNPNNINPVNEITDYEKFNDIVKSMEENGWVGNDILVYEGPNGVQSVTGSHRVYAARKVGIDVHVNVLDFKRGDIDYDIFEEDMNAFLEAQRDEDILNVFDNYDFVEKGYITKDQYNLMKLEVENNG